MKVKHAIIIVALGFCLDFIGTVMKILHWQGADIMILLVVVFKVVGVLFLLFKILTYPKIRDFLNW